MILQPPKSIVAKHPFAEIPMGAFAAVNNTWGDPYGTFVNQSVRTSMAGHPVKLRWDIKPDAHDAVIGFPNITCGKHPWSPESTTKKFPVCLGDMKTIPIKLDYKLWSRGKCNAVLDCWITRGPPHGPDEIIMEVMIWLESRGHMIPHGGVKQPSISGNLYTTWEGMTMFSTSSEAAPIVSFVPTYAVFGAFEGDILRYIRSASKLCGKDFDKCYLSAIELGAECVSGKGWMNINGFEVVSC